jgi:hypothetical protein
LLNVGEIGGGEGGVAHAAGRFALQPDWRYSRRISGLPPDLELESLIRRAPSAAEPQDFFRLFCYFVPPKTAKMLYL